MSIEIVTWRSVSAICYCTYSPWGGGCEFRR